MANENKWNLVGNTHPSYVSFASLLTNNSTQVEDTREAVYVYNGSAYVPVTTGYIQPGQAFFISASSNSAGAMTIAKDILSHQTGVTFYKKSNPRITLNLFDGSSTKSTEINYLEGKTSGLDRRYDLGTFTGVSSNFNIFSRLVSNSKGIDFMRQALPQDYENLVVPIGVKANTGKEITFSAEALNLPKDIKVYIEDRVSQKFTRIDNANYKITLNEELKGIGRFYLHTTQSALSIDKNVLLDNISVYKVNNTRLRIVGLSNGKSSMKLFNLLGKELINNSFDSNGVKEISLHNLSAGIYIVHLDTKAGKLTKKIIIE